MIFRQETDVVNADGEKVGELERVVLAPETNAVTDIVVREGFLFTHDKVVPIDLVAAAEEDVITLREYTGDWEDLPDFKAKQFIAVDQRELMRTDTPMGYYPAPVYWYPPVYASRHGVPRAYSQSTDRPYVLQTKRQIPEGAVALKQEAEVISADDETVGTIEELLTGPEADRVTHMVIAEGMLFKERKLIPSDWIEMVTADRVYLSVGSDFLENLPEYEPEAQT